MFTDDLVSPLRVVSLRDEAIDWFAMTREGVTPRDYAASRDQAAVRVLPGAHARWFTLLPLDTPTVGMVEECANDAAKLVRAFRYAVASVENFEGPGVALRPTLTIPWVNGTTRTIWNDAEIERLANFAGGQRTIYEMGELAYERALEGNGRSGGALFTPPRYLEPVLERIERQLAEQARALAGTRSSE